MKQQGSKYEFRHVPSVDAAPPFTDDRNGVEQQEWLAADNPDFTSALGIIVTAFVDLGFGKSPMQQARDAANLNL